MTTLRCHEGGTPRERERERGGFKPAHPPTLHLALLISSIWTFLSFILYYQLVTVGEVLP